MRPHAASEEEAKALGFGKPKGAKIVQIADGSPASLAHLQPGDIVLAIDSEEVSNASGLVARISALRPGTRVILKLLRSGEIKQQEAARAARPEQFPDRRPMLRIDPGMHTAPIQRIGVDAACNLMVTGSDDKTARLWALPEGGRGAPELLRTLRVPIGEGNDGKVYAVALSPNGKWVAAGGWDAKAEERANAGIYIFDAVMGRLVKRLGRLGNVIVHLAFSPDGSRLAATLFGGQGMRLCETGSWRLLAEDKDYGGKDSYGAAFDGANRLFAVALDGQIRRYGADGHLEAKAAAQGGKEPYSIAVHPDGAKLAIAFGDGTAVEVYDAHTLKRLYAADTGGIGEGSFYGVAWSADGARLYAGGTGNRAGIDLAPVSIWQDEGRGQRSEARLSQSTIMQLLPCGDDIAAGAADPAFGLIAANGERRVWQEGVTADMRGKVRDAFTLSADGKRVRFGLGFGGKEPVLFDLASFSLSDAPDNPAELLPPKTSGVAVEHWKNTHWNNEPVPTLDGKPIALEDHETSRSLAIAPDAARFVLGTGFWLRAYGADGKALWRKAIPSIAWGVNISGHGKLVAVAYDDGTIRWHRLSDGKELLALFVQAKDRRYIAWTSKGYYAASPGAEDLIGWHVNRDWDHAADFFPASRFRDQYNRPDIIKRVLDDLDEDQAIAEANRLINAKPAEDIAKKLPPVIVITSPAEGDTFATDRLTVRYTLRSPSGLPVSEVRALVDGRPLPGAATKGFIPVSTSGDTEGSIALDGLRPRDLTLSLIARSGDLDSTPFSIHLKFQGAPAQTTSSVSLYALVVGVSRFKDPNVPPLHWAAKDARDFAAALNEQNGRLYRKVEVRLLVDEDADSGSILDGLTWLQRQVSQGDVGVVFLSGHGVADPTGDYYYVANNAKIEYVGGVPLPTRSTSVPDTEISHALKQLAGNALFFLDTCHSGQAAGILFRGEQDHNKFINEIAGSANAIVLASSKGTEVSQSATSGNKARSPRLSSKA